jgi:hypothetical protein
MPIVVSCECGRRLQVREEFAGRRGQCPSCGRTFDLPSATPDPDGAIPTRVSTDLTAEPVARPAPLPEVEEVPAAAPELRNHAGEPLPRDVDFFTPPPPEIGAVVSAHSTLRKSVRPRPAGLRAGLALSIGGGVLLLILVLVAAARPRAAGHLVVWPTLAGLLAAGAAVLTTRFKHTCSYVGQEGVARFSCAGDRDRLVLQEVFLFKDAAELRTSQVRHYVNGAYTGTDYSFTWTDVGGQTRYVFRGRYQDQKGRPKPSNPYHFGRAAEVAWSNYLLPGAFRQLDLSGAVLFMLSGGGWIRVGRSGLRIHQGGKEEEWDAREIAGVTGDGGTVKIKRRDAREGWFSSSGVFKFDFSGLGNAQLFFFLVEKVLGVPVG